MKPKPSGFAVLAIIILIVAVVTTVLTSNGPSSRAPEIHHEPPVLSK
jgi:hypothetical protein